MMTKLIRDSHFPILFEDAALIFRVDDILDAWGRCIEVRRSTPHAIVKNDCGVYLEFRTNSVEPRVPERIYAHGMTPMEAAATERQVVLGDNTHPLIIDDSHINAMDGANYVRIRPQGSKLVTECVRIDD